MMQYLLFTLAAPIASFGTVRMAARAALDRTRPLAASMPAAFAVLGEAARRRRPIPLTQPRAATSSRRPIDIRRSAMSSGQSRSARTRRNGHRSVNRSVAIRSWIHGSVGLVMTVPPVAARREARNGSFAPSSRYSAAVGATSPTVRANGVVPGRVCVIRTAYAPGSISPRFVS